MKIRAIPIVAAVVVLLSTCGPGADVIQPIVVTSPVVYDGDDPALWIDEADLANSRVIVTDKNTDGSLFVFDLNGSEVPATRVHPIDRPNNVDVEYGLQIGGGSIDIAVVTERNTAKLRVYRLPDMVPIDGGGLPVFGGETDNACMGIGLYRRGDGAIFAIVSRTTGPSGSYLGQYRLEEEGSTGIVKATFVRYFGAFSGIKEIESICVDDELGFVYYSDEQAGIRKYRADPDAPDASVELALFGQDDFLADSEGISVYAVDSTTGYILVSDQQADLFRIYRREGEPGFPHEHLLLKTVALATSASDGSEVSARTLSTRFPGGLFIAMSDDRRFQFYSWEQIAKAPGVQLLSR
jgi:3-phytase